MIAWLIDNVQTDREKKVKEKGVWKKKTMQLNLWNKTAILWLSSRPPLIVVNQ